MKKFVFLGLTILLSVIKVFSQTCKYEVLYNPATCLYEAHMHVISSYTEPNDLYLGPSAFSIVIPASFPNTQITPITPVNPSDATWNDNSPIYAPVAAPSSDFHKIATDGATFNTGTDLSAGSNIILFTFSLPAASCINGVRMYVNWNWIPLQTNPDPSSSAPGMQGGDFRNSYQSYTPESYIGNVGNPVILPKPEVSSSYSISCDLSNLNLNSIGNSALGCGSLAYSWTGPYSYASNEQNPIVNPYAVSGIYKVTVTDNNHCSAIDSIVVAAYNPPSAPVISQVGNTLHSSASSGNQWYYNNEVIPGETSTAYSPIASGNYYVIVTDNFGCISDTSNVISIVVTSLSDDIGMAGIKTYPNPVSDELIISFEGNSDKVEFDILNIIGAVVAKGNLLQKTQVRTNNLASGVYLIRFYNSKLSGVKEFIKE